MLYHCPHSIGDAIVISKIKRTCGASDGRPENKRAAPARALGLPNGICCAHSLTLARLLLEPRTHLRGAADVHRARAAATARRRALSVVGGDGSSSQTALLAGYAYAHLIAQYLPGRASVAVHSGCCCFCRDLGASVGDRGGLGTPAGLGRGFLLIGLFTVLLIGLPILRWRRTRRC